MVDRDGVVLVPVVAVPVTVELATAVGGRRIATCRDRPAQTRDTCRSGDPCTDGLQYAPALERR